MIIEDGTLPRARPIRHVFPGADGGHAGTAGFEGGHRRGAQGLVVFDAEQIRAAQPLVAR